MTYPSQKSEIAVTELNGIPVVSIPDGTGRGNGRALANQIISAVKEAVPHAVHEQALS